MGTIALSLTSLAVFVCGNRFGLPTESCTDTDKHLIANFTTSISGKRHCYQ